MGTGGGGGGGDGTPDTSPLVLTTVLYTTNTVQ